jgi:hypothetical protein
MESPKSNHGDITAPLRSTWWVVLVLVSIAWTWLAVQVQRLFAPVLLFPLLVGGGVGGIAGLITRQFYVQNPRVNPLLIVMLGALAVVSLHGFVYLDYRREFQITFNADPRIRIFTENQTPIGPPGFLDYLHGQAVRGRPWIGGTWQGRGAWITWGIDAALVVASAIGACWFIGRPRPAGADG